MKNSVSIIACLFSVVVSKHSEDMDTYQNMMNELKSKQNDREGFKFRVCVPRNILLFGRTRTGKSTIAKVIENPLYIPEPRRLYAETREICFNQIAGECDDTVYHFNIIDSPGLFDLAQHGLETITNEKIQEIIDDCIKKDVTDIHAFGFVFSAEGGINNEDIQAMIFFKKKYPLLRNYTILLISHCEEKDSEERETFVNDFFQHPDAVRHDLKNFFGLGTYFTGCLRPQLRRLPNLESALNQMENICEMRQTLLKFLMERNDRFNIHRYHEEKDSNGRNIQPKTMAKIEANHNNYSFIIKAALFFLISSLLLIIFRKN